MCENEKKKGQKLFDLPEQGFEPQIFSNFPAHDLNFHGREGDEIKSKQASKRDMSLQFSKVSKYNYQTVCSNRIRSFIPDFFLDPFPCRDVLNPANKTNGSNI